MMTTRRCALRATLPMALMAILLSGTTLSAAEPLLVYVKEFPKSYPEYMRITLARDGAVTYTDRADDDQPLKMRVAPDLANTFFGLAEKLDRFDRTLEAPIKVAFTGAKTLTWDGPPKTTQAKYNYTQDVDAQAIQEFFERVNITGQLYYMLERTVKFDRLGVNRSLLLLESSWDKKDLVGEEVFLPLLDRVAKNDAYLNIARERAANLATTFRAAKAKQQDAASPQR